MIYGDDLIFRKFCARGTIADNGDYLVGVDEICAPEACDAVPNGKGEEKVFPGGERKVYSYTIELDVSAKPFEIGDHILLLRHGNPESKRQEYTVLGYHRYATIAKIWV